MSPVTMRIMKPISLKSNYPSACIYLDQDGKSLLPMSYYPKCPYSKTYLKCQFDRTFGMKQKNQVNPMGGKMTISERRIYTDGRKQDMSRWGEFFQFPYTLVNFRSNSQCVIKLHFREDIVCTVFVY